jgi:hypothetical protein
LFSCLDTIGCENVVKLLKDRLKTVSTIFVITHSESLKPLTVLSLSFNSLTTFSQPIVSKPSKHSSYKAILVLYDECFDGLDTIGCENVVKLLKDRLKTVSTIFVSQTMV